MDYIAKLKQGTLIKIFGQVRKMPKKTDYYKDYYFNVEDIYTMAEFEGKDPASEEKAGLEAKKEIPTEVDVPEKNTAAEDDIAIGDGKEENELGDAFTEVNPQNLDLLAEKYNGKKIKFKMNYVGRKDSVNYLSSLYPNDKFFELMTRGSVKMTYFSAIVEKTDENIDFFMNLKDDEPIEISGILKKYVSGTFSVYYMLIDKVKKD